MCTELVAVARRRAGGVDRDVDRRWPWLLVVLDAELEPDPALVAQILDRSPAAGISVVWLGRSVRVPRQAQAVLNCIASEVGPSELWFRDPERRSMRLEVEPVQPGVTDRAVRALAPLRDASAVHATSAIPRVVPLFAALGLEDAALEPNRQGLVHAVSQRLVERWLVERWLDRCGFETTEAWLRFNNTPAPLTLRANRLRATPEEVIERLAQDDVHLLRGRYAPDALIVESGHPLRDRPTGLFVVQDKARALPS